MNLRIAIFDDEDRQREAWSQRLKRLELGEIVFLDNFEDAIEQLEERRSKVRLEQGVENLADLEIASIFDTIDILIIDYDLLYSTRLTGEEIAYLLRCYSKCGLVVALNQFGATKSFDLTLGGHLGSFADLNIGSEFFDNPGLWSADRSAWKPFRPWSWPVLPILYGSFQQRVRDVSRNLNKPVLYSLGLGIEEAGILPRTTLEHIQSRKSTPESTTFRDFVVQSDNGLKLKDAQGPVEELIPRIAAARLHRWLECLVLGGQEILVDAPHLVTRYPSLLKGPISQQETWDRTARIESVKGLDQKLIQNQAFPLPHWLSRPAWYWSHVRTNETISEVADPWSVKQHDWVFCEDASCFTKRDAARGFVAELPTSFSRRYVAKIDDIGYHPGVRFSL